MTRLRILFTGESLSKYWNYRNKKALIWEGFTGEVEFRGLQKVY